VFVFGDLAMGQLFQRRPAPTPPAHLESVGREMHHRHQGREMMMPLPMGRDMSMQTQHRVPPTAPMGRDMHQGREIYVPTRGIQIEKDQPAPMPGHTQPPVQSQPLPSAPPQIQPQPQRLVPQTQTIAVHQHQAHRGFGRQLRLGVGAEEHSGAGVLVTHVLENSPGHLAELVAGDVILEINRMPINDLIDYSYAVDRSPETMIMRVANNGQEYTITVELRR